MRKTYKKVISLCAVLIFALALIPTSAFADPFTAVAVGGIGGASGAGLFGAMAGISGIQIGGSQPFSDDAIWSSLDPDHIYFSGDKGQITEPDPVTGIPTVYDYISVDIGDWLDAQTNFISDFVSTYQVDDNDSGNISTPESYQGAPFNINTSYYVYTPITGIQTVTNDAHSSSLYVFNLQQYTLTLQKNYNYWDIYAYNNGVQFEHINNANLGNGPFNIGIGYAIFTRYGAHDLKICLRTEDISKAAYVGISGTTTAGSSTAWTSTTVNTGVFNNWENPTIKIPADSWSPSDPVLWEIEEFLAELTYKFNNGAGEDIIIEDNNSPPPPVPIPTIPLGDIPTDEWYDLFGLPVLEGQEEIHQDLQDFNDSVSDGLSDIGEQLDDANDSLESIDTNIEVGNGLLGDLKSIGQSIVSKLDSILQGVQDLVQEIVLSTETFIAGLLNSIMGGLGGWLSTMREAFSIWHYVVEWVGSISTVFSWFWSVAGSTSYYIQLPIYASLAGAVVLAFYKRFGK